MRTVSAALLLLALAGVQSVNAICSTCYNVPGKPCQHDNDGHCVGYYPGTTTCVAGSTLCNDGPQCTSHCALGSDPCTHLFDGHCMPYGPAGVCAPGSGICADGDLYLPPLNGAPTGNTNPPPTASSGCTACALGTSGPCKHDNDGTCFSYTPGSPGTCPAGTSQCPMCTTCAAGTSGPCQHDNDDTCMAYVAGTTNCPAGSTKCALETAMIAAIEVASGSCGTCNSKTAGPCHHNAVNSICHHYYTGTTTCPAGTHECLGCTGCTGGTSGPCKHLKNNNCIAYSSGNNCPAGSVRCSDGVAGGHAVASCSGCWPGTSGDCQSGNTVCYDYFPGTTTCFPGTSKCSTAGSLAAEPTVIVDLTLAGVDGDNVDVAGIEEAIVSVSGADGVHVDTVTTLTDGSRRGRSLAESAVAVGAVAVVTTESGKNPAEVAAKLDAAAADGTLAQAMQQNGNAVSSVAANSPAQAVGEAGKKAPASTGISTLAIALIAVGVVAAVALVTAGVLFHKQRSNDMPAPRKLSPRIITPRSAAEGATNA